jgi:hypothetical protein
MPTMKTDVLRDHVFREAHLTGLISAIDGSFVIPGKAPAITQRAAGANMSVDIGAFSYVLQGVFRIKTSTTNIEFAASEATPRIDLLYVDPADNAIKILKGTAKAKKPATEANWLKWEEPYPASFGAKDGLLLAEIEIPANATSILNENIRRIAVPGRAAYFDGPYSVEVFQLNGEIIARKADGTILYSGNSATAAFDEAVDGCPDDGKIFIGPGTYELVADKQFYLTGTIENPSDLFYYCIGIMEGKRAHLEGAGRGVTILKLANNQHYADHHCVMILNRTTGPIADGHTGFSVRNMTLDGNRANQATEYKDGASLILTGGIRKNEVYENLEFRNSYGYGVYPGNNGSGPVDNLIIDNIIASNCYKSAICIDTAKNAVITNCVISNSSSGLEILGNTDYASRTNDNIAVSDVVCYRAGITIWCINGLVMTNCTMDISGATVHSYGVQVHCSHNIEVFNCRFIASGTQYVSYMDGGQYRYDGTYKNVNFRSCTFKGLYALKAFGTAKINAYDCTLHGLSNGAAVLLRELEEPIAPEVYLERCTLVAEDSTTKLIDMAPYSTLTLMKCKAPYIGPMTIEGGLYSQECEGLGLEGYNGRWRRLDNIAFETTPLSNCSITMKVDRASVIKTGTPIKILTSDGVRYGIITEIGSTYIVFAGAPLSGTIYSVWLGNPDMVCQLDLIVPGVFGNATGPILWSKANTSFLWKVGPAYLVSWSSRVKTMDSVAQPFVTPTIDGYGIDTRSAGGGIQVNSSWQHSSGDAHTSHYRIEFGDPVDIYVNTAGGAGNATHLTMSLTFVLED